MKTARVHHAARRRGGCVAARGAGAAARAMRRIGVLLILAASDVDGVRALTRSCSGCRSLGGPTAATLRIDYRWAAGDADRLPHAGRNLSALGAGSSPCREHARHCAALQQQTRTIPIVFVQVADPVGAGFVASLARPGGNVTGLDHFESTISGKWLELLKEIAPERTRVAVLVQSADVSWWWVI